LQLSNLSKKDRNQAIIKKEAQNKLNIHQNNRCSIVADHNIKGKKIDEYPIEEYDYIERFIAFTLKFVAIFGSVTLCTPICIRYRGVII